MEQQGYLTNNNYNGNKNPGVGKHYNAALYMRFSKDDKKETKKREGEHCDDISRVRF